LPSPAIGRRGFFDGMQNAVERKLVVEDLPLWFKMIIWAVVGGTVIWTVVAMLYWGLTPN
jgi:hypothetical protein